MSSERRQQDRVLLNQLCDGDSSAFWALWLRHAPHLRAVCRRYMQRSRPDTEDAVSRSMMIAREKLPEHAREIIDVEAWLTRLTSNVCLDIKKERCRGTLRSDPLDENVLLRREPTLGELRTPEETCFSAQLREAIGDAFEQLPPSLGAAAQLRFLQEASYTTIAEQLLITETTARKRVQKARVVLRAHLAPLVSAPRE